jgi:hypothetical protein
MFETCEEKEKLPTSYKGLPVTLRETNFKQQVPFVDYYGYLETVDDTNSLEEDFVIIEFEGRFLSVDPYPDPVQFGPNWLSSWELIKIYHLDDGKVAFMNYHKRYMTLAEDQTIRFTEDRIDSNNTFRLIRLEGQQFAIKASNDRFVCSENAFQNVTANRKEIAEWETFKIHKVIPPR